MVLDDTIVAVSSPAGPGRRAVVRLSGPQALAIVGRVFSPREAASLAAWPTFTARPGRVRLEVEGVGPMDLPATAYLMRGPRSYTRQTVVELHVGAWPAVLGPLLERLAALGARPAGPGEFTYRALASGRLDLARAEAVMAVIAASSEAQLRAAGDLLRGHLSRDLEGRTDRLVDLLADVEADLDFTDPLAPPPDPALLAGRIEALRADLAALGRHSRSLETLSGEARLVLAGRSNAGKSSLFNRLLEADRALVSPAAGTTRDELRAAVHLGDVTVVLSDTAGLEGRALVDGERGANGLAEGAGKGKGAFSERPAKEPVAARARAKALDALAGADLVLVCLDATVPCHDPAAELLALVTTPLVAAVTKCDLAPPDRAAVWLRERGIEDAAVVPTSAVTGAGLDCLRRALREAVVGGRVDREAARPVMTARHRSALAEAAGALGRAARTARAGLGEELVAVELREALDALGSILGRRAPEAVLASIFARFCVGK